jgi:hypothetical protein
MLAAIGTAPGSAGTLQDGGTILLRGDGSGIVHYVAQGPSIPGTYEDDCPEACSVTWPLQGATVTLTATPLEDSRFGGWGGMCAAAGTNRTCTFVGVAGRNVVEARFLPPKIDILRVPIRGTTTLRLAPSPVLKLRRQGWRLQAMAPATLHGRTLKLPIAPTGPLSIFHTTSSVQVEKSVRGCVVTLDPSYTVHHAGGIRLSRPGGRLHRLPLDKPAISSRTGSPSFLFRDARDTSVAKSGKLTKGRPGFSVDIFEQKASERLVSKSTFRVSGLRTRVTSNSWDNLVEGSAKPAITSGPFAAVELNVRIPPTACS